MYSAHVAYLLTFRCYNSWLPGDSRGWTQHGDKYGEPWRPPNKNLEAKCSRSAKGQFIPLNSSERTVATEAIHQFCNRLKWTLHALNVRTNHVHAVVTCSYSPDLAINKLKGTITETFCNCGLRKPNVKIWSKGGSRRYLWTEEDLAGAIQYVLEEQ